MLAAQEEAPVVDAQVHRRAQVELEREPAVVAAGRAVLRHAVLQDHRHQRISADDRRPQLDAAHGLVLGPHQAPGQPHARIAGVATARLGGGGDVAPGRGILGGAVVGASAEVGPASGWSMVTGVAGTDSPGPGAGAPPLHSQ